MSTAPCRIRLSRAKGWRMPENTVHVARPSRFGNPFTVASVRRAGMFTTQHHAAALCTEGFRIWLATPAWRDYWAGDESEAKRAEMLAALPSLRGKNLACWCALDQPCHADVLLEIANAGQVEHPATPLIDEARIARASIQQEGS